jgi:hypothetical protein
MIKLEITLPRPSVQQGYALATDPVSSKQLDYLAVALAARAR